MVLVRARIASSNVVLPDWNGPTSAMHRGPLPLPPLFAIALPPKKSGGGRTSFQTIRGIGKRRHTAAVGRGAAKLQCRNQVSRHRVVNGCRDGAPTFKAERTNSRPS